MAQRTQGDTGAPGQPTVMGARHISISMIGPCQDIPLFEFRSPFIRQIAPCNHLYLLELNSCIPLIPNLKDRSSADVRMCGQVTTFLDKLLQRLMASHSYKLADH